eukprot:822961-Rhodomonas_salina.6
MGSATSAWYLICTSTLYTLYLPASSHRGHEDGNESANQTCCAKKRASANDTGSGAGILALHTAPRHTHQGLTVMSFAEKPGAPPPPRAPSVPGIESQTRTSGYPSRLPL